jgi:SAM-dependent methyltransferase
LSQENFFIKSGYTSRSKPAYCDKTLEATLNLIWQPDVYPLTALLARQINCSYIIDIGCGSASKLVDLHPEFQIIGIDFGRNIGFCRKTYPFGNWLEADLEHYGNISFNPDLLKKAAIICSDVIEHLIDPTALLENLRDLLNYAPVALLSTPERDFTYGESNFGPPPNHCHVREWNMSEFKALLMAAGLRVDFIGLTASNNKDFELRTTLAVLGNNDWSSEFAARLNVMCKRELELLNTKRLANIGNPLSQMP